MNYGDFWSKALFPFYERLRGRPTPAIQAVLAQSQFFSADELARRQRADLRLLLEHAKASTPFYGQWFAQTGQSPEQIAESGDLSALPLVDKAMLMAHPDHFRAAPAPPGSYQKRTGGSTGRPLVFAMDPGSDHWRTAVYRRGYGWAGCREGDRQLYLWGGDVAPVSTVYRLRREAFRRLARMRFHSSFGLGPDQLDAVLADIDRFKPLCVVGYTSALDALARHAAARGWRPKRPPRSVISGAEALRPQERQRIERALAAPVFETYGCREFMLIAAQCPERRGLHVSAENLVVEVLAEGRPARPGELGEVVVTDLHNFAQPFIRYKTGDLARPAAGPCPCGRGLPLLEGIEGRILDMIRAPGGHLLPGEFFPHLLKNFDAIAEFQARQDSPEHLFIDVVLRQELSQTDRQLIQRALAAAAPGLAAEIRPVEAIAPTPAGKRRVTIGLPPQGDRP